uniref:hydroxymethylglutaryl-CoA lyase n=1 Tax=Romanomermis culicivorax TaxID=13658 RepID=A0A915JA02_ROMCU
MPAYVSFLRTGIFKRFPTAARCGGQYSLRINKLSTRTDFVRIVEVGPLLYVTVSFYSRRNIRCSIEKSLSRASEMVRLAKKHHVRVRGYVSCIVGCPYEGKIDPVMVLKVSEKLADLGCYEISLGDTIGVATPGDISRLLKSMFKILPAQKIALHCHDTYGQALANILRGFDLGIRTFDSSIAGLGGCPYAPGASGNVATEDVVYMLNGMGVSTVSFLDLFVVLVTGWDTGVDFNKLIEVSQWLSTKVLNRPPVSKVAFAIYGSKCDNLLDRD